MNHDKSSTGVSLRHIIANAISRLLGVLQEDGRQLHLALIHGYMYSGNFGTNAKTAELVIWDASSYYVMELNVWRGNEVMQGSAERYLRNLRKGEPKEE